MKRLFVLLAVGCGSSATAVVVPDAAVHVDAAPLPDAPPLPDAHVALPDAGGPDAGCATDFVYLKDKQFYRHGVPWFPISVNFEFEIRHLAGSGGGSDGGTYFLAPAHSYCTDNICCSDEATCLLMLKADLAQARSLGVDSLRMVGLAWKPAADGHLYLDCIDHSPTDIFACTADDQLLTSSDVPLALTAQAVALMKDAGLTGILLAGHGNIDGPKSRAEYATWLGRLATQFADEPALMAVDLMNEPEYEADNTGIAKTDANAIVRTWYEAVRAGSQHLMVTMGLGDLTVAQAWDAQILPLDFASPHIYTSGVWDDAARADLNTQYGWLHDRSYAALIGETSQPISTMGNESDQAAFATMSFGLAKACGLMGLQWWEYRDVTWSLTDEFGLVRLDGTEKPAAAVFQGAADIAPAESCYVPVDSGSRGGNTAFHTTGTVLGAQGLPLAEAVVMAWSCPDWGTFYWTVSDRNGEFQLDTDKLVVDVRVSGAGMSVTSTGVDCGENRATKTVGTLQVNPVVVNTSVTTPTACYVYPTR